MGRRERGGIQGGVRELLREAGYSVERWVYFDSAGYVFGRASETELDIVVKDGRRIAVEMTSAVKRGDLSAIRRKAELYAKATGASLDRVLVVTPYTTETPSTSRPSRRSWGCR